MVNKLIPLFAFMFVFNTTIFPGERFSVPYRPEIDLTKSGVIFECKNVIFSVDISRPLTPFKKLKLTVNVKKDNKPINSFKIKAKINMKMDMGNFNYDFSIEENSYKLDFMLPKCLWGDKRWFIKLIIHDKEYICDKVLLFDMER